MRKRVAAVIAFAALCLAVLAYVKQEPWRALVQPSDSYREGGFAVGIAGQVADWGDPRNETRTTYTSGPDGAQLGSFRTGTFQAPSRFRCYLAGFPLSPGIRIFLKDTQTGRELPLGSTLNALNSWQERIWTLPPAWRNHQVQLQVEDHATDPTTGWIALTLPETTPSVFIPSLGRAVYRSIFLILELVWFLIPGIGIALVVPVRPAVRFAAFALICAATVGYTVFWVYLLNPKAGVLASGLVLAAGIGLIWRFRRPFARELLLMLAAVMLTAVCYNALGFLYYTDDGPGELAQARFTVESMPPDNMLQYLFAWDIYYGHSVRPFLIENVHSSDRPPLETALTLEQWPFWRMLTSLHSYQVLGVGLQCLWILGVWILLRESGISPPATAAVLSFLFFTGFAWEHSFYIWPKLLAAAFCLIGMAAIPIFRGSPRPFTMRETLIAAAAFSLSLLSHSGSGFTILAIVIFLTFHRALPPWRMVLPAIALAILLLAPWRAYQVLIDPPGDTLLKLHLAGVTDQKIGLWAALFQGYGHMTFVQIVSAKLQNFKALFLMSFWRPGTQMPIVLRNLVDLSFFAFFPCAGLLNLGLLARLRLHRTDPVIRFADRLLAIALLTLVVWCLLLFEPGSTVVHQGSFAAVLLYFAAMSLYLHAWSRRWMLILTGVQAAIVFPVHVFLVPVITQMSKVTYNGGLDPGMAIVAILSLAALAAGAVYMNRQGQLL